MKLKLQKICTGIIDLDVERKRISESFEDDPQTQSHLNKLMDLIEAQKWEEAKKELDKKWWDGRDKVVECPRTEFIGLLDFTENEGFDLWASYADLVYNMINRPNMYKAERIN